MQHKAFYKATLRKKLYELYAGWGAARECRKKIWTIFSIDFYIVENSITNIIIIIIIIMSTITICIIIIIILRTLVL